MWGKDVEEIEEEHMGERRQLNLLEQILWKEEAACGAGADVVAGGHAVRWQQA